MGMSVTNGSAMLFQRAIECGLVIGPGTRMAELGNQHVRHFTKRPVAAKRLFTYFGVEHDSFDTNGNDGAMKVDLGKPLPSKFVGQYHVVTNFGTAEHVRNQYQCFKNIAALCMPDGMMIHSLPIAGEWPGHGLVAGYTLEQAKNFFAVCGYTVIECLRNRQHKPACVSALVYNTLAPFIDEDTFYSVMPKV